MFRRSSLTHKQSSQLLALTNFLSPLLCSLKSIQELMVWEVRNPIGEHITIIFQIDIMLNCLHIYLYTSRLVQLSVPILEASLWRRNQLIQRLTLTPLQRLSLENTRVSCVYLTIPSAKDLGHLHGPFPRPYRNKEHKNWILTCTMRWLYMRKLWGSFKVLKLCLHKVVFNSKIFED